MKPHLSAEALKSIAVVLMIFDHMVINFIFMAPLFMAGRTAGKAAAPVMFFFLAEGYRHTGDIGRYFKRLIIGALVSQIPYSLFMNRGALLSSGGNIMFTMVIALAALYVYENGKDAVVKYAVIFALIMVSAFSDWGISGPIFTLSFFIPKSRRGKIAAYLTVSMVKAFAVYMLYGTGQMLVSYLISPYIAATLIALYDESRGACRHKLAFYAVYPLQFICIFAARNIIRGF